MGTDSNRNPNRPSGRGIFENRSAAIYFVDDNGRSLYIVDWRMVVVERGMSYTM